MKVQVHFDEKTIIAVLATVVGFVLQYGPSLQQLFGSSVKAQHIIGGVVIACGLVAGLLADFGVNVRLFGGGGGSSVDSVPSRSAEPPS
jgi:hypothetical protein